jgi:hypothetical protein
MNDAPLVKLTGMYENTAAKSGRRYFVGYLGGVKLLLLENTKAEPGEPGWNLCITARPERCDGPQTREPAMAGTPPAPAAALARQRTPQRRPGPFHQPEPDDGFDWDRGDPLPFGDERE